MTTETRVRRSQVGIKVRHARSCPAGKSSAACKCKPTYQAHVWSARDKKRIWKSFPTLAAAKAWRHDAYGGLRLGTMKAPTQTRLRDAAEAWLAGVKDGTIRTRSGDDYKPSVVRGYESALRKEILPQLGGARLSDIRRPDLQDLADRMLASGLDPSTVRNHLMPLRAIYRRAVTRGEVAVNPTAGLELAAVRGKRDRIASPVEALTLLSALPEGDRALWASAFYAGLRRGELMALRWGDVDLAAGIIRVERSRDEKDGAIEPKSAAGRRTVPIPAVLRDYLDEYKLRLGRDEGLVFGSTADRPFTPSNIRLRAQRAWARTLACGHPKAGDPDHAESAKPTWFCAECNESRPAIDPIGLHECRHTFASLMIGAGVNAKTLSTYLGHSSITITFDRYGHLMPGNEGEAAALLDAYLERANTAARLAQVAQPT